MTLFSSPLVGTAGANVLTSNHGGDTLRVVAPTTGNRWVFSAGGYGVERVTDSDGNNRLEGADVGGGGRGGLLRSFYWPGTPPADAWHLTQIRNSADTHIVGSTLLSTGKITFRRNTFNYVSTSNPAILDMLGRPAGWYFLETIAEPSTDTYEQRLYDQNLVELAEGITTSAGMNTALVPEWYRAGGNTATSGIALDQMIALLAWGSTEDATIAENYSIAVPPEIVVTTDGVYHVVDMSDTVTSGTTTWTCTDPDGLTVTQIAPGIFIAAQDGGTHTLTFQVTDDGGVDTVDITVDPLAVGGSVRGGMLIRRGGVAI